MIESRGKFQRSFSTASQSGISEFSDGGSVADCLQMVDGNFRVLLDKLDALELRDETIVIFAGDNGRDSRTK